MTSTQLLQNGAYPTPCLKGGEEQIIHHPPHYIEGRTIEPIDVIESYGLGHHLACVVKYIARCGRKEDGIKDLKKAQWYAERLQKKGSSLRVHETWNTGKGPTPEEICRDWQLGQDLSDALTFLIRAHVEREPALLEELSRSLLRALTQIIQQRQGNTTHDV